MDTQSQTFINKRDLIPNVTVRVWKTDQDLVAARIYVARYAENEADLAELLEMLGIQEGVENGSSH